MADNTKGLASTSQTPLHEQLRRFIENVRAHPGEIESSEYSITTPISWDGLGYAMHPLAAFEEMADALEAAAALRAPTIAADPVEQDTLVAAKAEHDEYHVVYYEDCVWCRSDNVDNLRKRIADLEAPTIAAPSPSNEVTPEKVEAGDSRDKLYDTIEKWRAHFDGFSQDPSRGNDDYYAGMASGLTIALQEIDRARYDREAALKARKPADDGAGQ